MSRTNIVIFKLPELFKILNEIKKYISINFELVEDLQGIKKLSDKNSILPEIPKLKVPYLLDFTLP